jgi:hypothetical protein
MRPTKPVRAHRDIGVLQNNALLSHGRSADSQAESRAAALSETPGRPERHALRDGRGTRPTARRLPRRLAPFHRIMTNSELVRYSRFAKRHLDEDRFLVVDAAVEALAW